MTDMPPLETERLLIRPFVMGDLEDIHRILDIELAEADFGDEGAQPREGRRGWLEWTIMNYRQLAILNQPPYGDRAVTLKAGGELIGAVGFVPSLRPFGKLPYFQDRGRQPADGCFTPEFGLFWAIRPRFQRQGYAGEAAGALIGYAFETLHLARLVATTTDDNLASIAVMKKLGMRIERNPSPEPAWFQVVGILERE